MGQAKIVILQIKIIAIKNTLQVPNNETILGNHMGLSAIFCTQIHVITY